MALRSRGHGRRRVSVPAPFKWVRFLFSIHSDLRKT